jgi:Flp pilus assembly pilin Flp
MEIFMSLAKEYGLFVALVAWVLWTNDKREKKYIDREEKYIDIVKTLSEEVKIRLTKIENTLRRR